MTRAPLQEHAATVKRLAQIMHSDLLPMNREWYTFVQSINDLGLHHQFLAKGVATVEDALREGEADLLATQLHKSRVGSRQVEAELATTHSEAEAVTLVAVATTKLSTASKVAQVTDMVAKLVETLT